MSHNRTIPRIRFMFNYCLSWSSREVTTYMTSWSGSGHSWLNSGTPITSSSFNTSATVSITFSFSLHFVLTNSETREVSKRSFSSLFNSFSINSMVFRVRLGRFLSLTHFFWMRLFLSLNHFWANCLDSGTSITTVLFISWSYTSSNAWYISSVSIHVAVIMSFMHCFTCILASLNRTFSPLWVG